MCSSNLLSYKLNSPQIKNNLGKKTPHNSVIAFLIHAWNLCKELSHKSDLQFELTIEFAKFTENLLLFLAA